MQSFGKVKTRFFFSSCSLVSFVVGLCLLTAGCAGTPTHPAWSNATGAEQHERLLWKAISEKDWVNVERHLSPTFIGVNADGQSFDRAGWLGYWKSSPLAEFSLGEVSLQPEGPDMKMTYTFHAQGARGSSPASPEGFQVISVWQEIKSRWFLTATSFTPIRKSAVH